MLRRSALQAAARVNKNGRGNVPSVVVACAGTRSSNPAPPNTPMKRDRCLDDRPELHSTMRQKGLAYCNAGRMPDAFLHGQVPVRNACT
jgi:hypothetical protein